MPLQQTATARCIQVQRHWRFKNIVAGTYLRWIKQVIHQIHRMAHQIAMNAAPWACSVQAFHSH
ncbi:MAG: hypothetical protein WCH92_13895 [Betaproteobacteria bacterium]